MSLSDKITKKGNITAINVREAVEELIESRDIWQGDCGCCNTWLKKIYEIFGEDLCKESEGK